MNKIYQLILILIAAAILVYLGMNYNVVRIPPNYYTVCPDGMIVGADVHFCADRQALECIGRICEPTEQSPYYWLYHR